MPSSIVVDPAVFDPAAIPAETLALNKDIVARLEAEPTGLTIQEVRARAPAGARRISAAAEVAARRNDHDRRAGRASSNCASSRRRSRAASIYHIHGGGWSIGATDQLDPVLERFADDCGMACVSVEYRLAPEHQYPAGPDDCEAAALWIVREGTKRFGTTKLAIGGELAGGHLSAVTLLRLRDRHKLTPFSAALLNYGCFDLGMTPSARRWGDEKLVLNTAGIVGFRKCFLPPGTDMDEPGRVAALRRSARHAGRAVHRRHARLAARRLRCSWRRAGSRPATPRSSRSIPAPATASSASTFAQRDEAVTRMETFLDAAHRERTSS